MKGVVAAALVMFIGCGDDRKDIEVFADRACACHDRACAETLIAEFATWTTSHKLVHDDRDMKAAQRIGKCTIDAGLPLEKLQSAMSGI
jgi:hypothetical protein